MTALESAWKRITAWYDANTPEGTLEMALGATDEEIAALEKEIGCELTEELREYFRLHNGSRRENYLIHYGAVLSIKGILKEHRMQKQRQRESGWGLGEDWVPLDSQGPVKPLWWTPNRLHPLDASGDGILADFDPADGGQIGQIIEHSHEVGPQRVLAPSFTSWLMEIADGLERGDYHYVEAEETVAPPGMYD